MSSTISQRCLDICAGGAGTTAVSAIPNGRLWATSKQKDFVWQLRYALNIDEDTEPKCVEDELKSFREAMTAMQAAMAQLEARQARIDNDRERTKDFFVSVWTTRQDWEEVARWCATKGVVSTDRRELLKCLWNHIRMGGCDEDMDLEDWEAVREAFPSRFKAPVESGDESEGDKTAK